MNSVQAVVITSDLLVNWKMSQKNGILPILSKPVFLSFSYQEQNEWQMIAVFFWAFLFQNISPKNVHFVFFTWWYSSQKILVWVENRL